MSTRDYLDFVLRISRADDGYVAIVINSPAGEGEAEFDLDPSDQAVREFVDLLGLVGDTRQPVGRSLRLTVERNTAAPTDAPSAIAREFGEALFDTALSGDVRELLRSSITKAGQKGAGLRVMLRFDDVPELAQLPWEYLYDTEERRYLDVTADVALVRYLELKQSVEPLEVELPLRVLAVIADTPPQLDVEREWRMLQKALSGVQNANRVTLERVEPATLRELQDRLRKRDYHVLHFIGHGEFVEGDEGGGALMFVDEKSGSAPVTGTALATILGDHDSLRLAVLNACEGARGGLNGPQSGVAHSLLSRGVPAVLAMQFPITDEAAIDFTQVFYGAIADDYPIEAAVGEARKAIYSDEEGLEWGTPVLFSRSPNGHLWRTHAKPLNKLSLAIAAGAVLALAAWIVLDILRDSMMPGDFNIAVAEFSAAPGQDNDRDARDADHLSGRVYEILKQEVDQFDPVLGAALWHDSMGFMEKDVKIGTVAGDTASERSASAEALARRIGANVVVYGVLKPTETNRGSFSPEFFVTELKNQADEIVGPHALGSDIELYLPLSTPSNAVRANRLVTPRANLLAQFTAGLVHELSGDPERALITFKDAESGLIGDEKDGREVLFLFIGRELGHLARLSKNPIESEAFLEESRTYYQKAIDANENYVRARIGLGNYYYTRAQKQAPRERLQNPDLESAVDQFIRAASPISGSDLVQLKARMGIGNTYRLWLEADHALDDVEMAEEHLDLAVDQFGKVLALAGDDHLEQAGHTHLMIGATYEAQAREFSGPGDTELQVSYYRQAYDEYEACAEIADTGSGGWFLEELRDLSCLPFQERVCRELERLGTTCG